MTDSSHLLNILQNHAAKHVPLQLVEEQGEIQSVSLPLSGETFPGNTNVNLTPEHQVTLLQLYYYIKYYDETRRGEYIKNATVHRLSMDLRKIAESVRP